MPRFIIIPFAVTLLTAACGPAVSSGLFSEMPLPPASGDVAIFSTRAPTCAYDEIGLIHVQRRHGFTDLQAMIDALRVRARAMGGTAVVGVGLTPKLSGSVPAENSVTVSTEAGLSGTVVRFRDNACRE
jgi:hypothetical protein